MTISKTQIQISTVQAIFGLIITISSILGFFYKAQANNVESVHNVSERVTKLEAVLPNLDRRLENIEGSMNTITSVLLSN